MEMLRKEIKEAINYYENQLNILAEKRKKERKTSEKERLIADINTVRLMLTLAKREAE
jgi:hypothetical protein